MPVSVVVFSILQHPSLVAEKPQMGTSLDSLFQKQDSILMPTVCLRNDLADLEKPSPIFLNIGYRVEDISIVYGRAGVRQNNAVCWHVADK